MNDFGRRTALVTGGATGIGAAITSRLAGDGLNVFAVQRTDDEASAGRAMFAAHVASDRIEVAAHDLSTGPGCTASIDHCVARFGGLDILVNNAGISGMAALSALADYSDEDIDMAVLDGRLPALTPYFESVTLDGVFFAGNVTQAAQGLRKHGVASVSGMVCGLRYNARILARHLAETVGGIEVPRPPVERADVVPYVLAELDRAPEIVMQKGYLARVLSVSGEEVLDEGILPLEAFVDGSTDGVAATLEFDADEEIRPALYVRSGGVLRETLLPPHPLRRYDVLAYREALDDLLRPLAG